MDRKLYKLPIFGGKTPAWSCPTCKSGTLNIKKNTFHYEETSLSRSAHSHEDWGPDWIRTTFACLLECNQAGCKDIVSCSGTGEVDYEVEYDDEGCSIGVPTDYFTPKHFSPPLEFFQIPKKTPELVSTEISKSFGLFFADPSSAANHVRISLEHLLTELKVKRFEKKTEEGPS